MELGGSEIKELGSLSWDVGTDRVLGVRMLGCFLRFFSPHRI